MIKLMSASKARELVLLSEKEQKAQLVQLAQNSITKASLDCEYACCIDATGKAGVTELTELLEKEGYKVFTQHSNCNEGNNWITAMTISWRKEA